MSDQTNVFFLRCSYQLKMKFTNLPPWAWKTHASFPVLIQPFTASRTSPFTSLYNNSLVFGSNTCSCKQAPKRWLTQSLQMVTYQAVPTSTLYEKLWVWMNNVNFARTTWSLNEKINFVQTTSLNEQQQVCANIKFERAMSTLREKYGVFEQKNNFEQTTTSLNELCLFYTNNIKFEWTTSTLQDQCSHLSEQRRSNFSILGTKTRPWKFVDLACNVPWLHALFKPKILRQKTIF